MDEIKDTSTPSYANEGREIEALRLYLMEKDAIIRKQSKLITEQAAMIDELLRENQAMAKKLNKADVLLRALRVVAELMGDGEEGLLSGAEEGQ